MMGLNHMMDQLDLDRRIEDALETARIFERESDDCFAKGDVLRGSRLLRYYILSLRHAEQLAERRTKAAA